MVSTGGTGAQPQERSFVDGDSFAAPAYAFELDHAGHFRKQRVVFPYADVVAGSDRSSTLPHDDGPSRDGLPAIDLGASPLPLRVTAIFGGTDTFFVSHFILL